MQVVQPGYIIARPTTYDNTINFFWSDRLPSGPADLVVRVHNLEFEVPNDFNYNNELAEKLRTDRAVLEGQIDALNEEVLSITERINSLVKNERT